MSAPIKRKRSSIDEGTAGAAPASAEGGAARKHAHFDASADEHAAAGRAPPPPPPLEDAAAAQAREGLRGWIREARQLQRELLAQREGSVPGVGSSPADASFSAGDALAPPPPRPRRKRQIDWSPQDLIAFADWASPHRPASAAGLLDAPSGACVSLCANLPEGTSKGKDAASAAQPNGGGRAANGSSSGSGSGSSDSPEDAKAKGARPKHPRFAHRLFPPCLLTKQQEQLAAQAQLAQLQQQQGATLASAAAPPPLPLPLAPPAQLFGPHHFLHPAHLARPSLVSFSPSGRTLVAYFPPASASASGSAFGAGPASASAGAAATAAGAPRLGRLCIWVQPTRARALNAWALRQQLVCNTGAGLLDGANAGAGTGAGMGAGIGMGMAPGASAEALALAALLHDRPEVDQLTDEPIEICWLGAGRQLSATPSAAAAKAHPQSRGRAPARGPQFPARKVRASARPSPFLANAAGGGAPFEAEQEEQAFLLVGSSGAVYTFHRRPSAAVGADATAALVPGPPLFAILEADLLGACLAPAAATVSAPANGSGAPAVTQPPPAGASGKRRAYTTATPRLTARSVTQACVGLVADSSTLFVATRSTRAAHQPVRAPLAPPPQQQQQQQQPPSQQAAGGSVPTSQTSPTAFFSGSGTGATPLLSAMNGAPTPQASGLVDSSQPGASQVNGGGGSTAGHSPVALLGGSQPRAQHGSMGAASPPDTLSALAGMPGIASAINGASGTGSSPRPAATGTPTMGGTPGMFTPRPSGLAASVAQLQAALPPHLQQSPSPAGAHALFGTPPTFAHGAANGAPSKLAGASGAPTPGTAAAVASIGAASPRYGSGAGAGARHGFLEAGAHDSWQDAILITEVRIDWSGASTRMTTQLLPPIWPLAVDADGNGDAPDAAPTRIHDLHFSQVPPVMAAGTADAPPSASAGLYLCAALTAPQYADGEGAGASEQTRLRRWRVDLQDPKEALSKAFRQFDKSDKAASAAEAKPPARDSLEWTFRAEPDALVSYAAVEFLPHRPLPLSVPELVVCLSSSAQGQSTPSAALKVWDALEGRIGDERQDALVPGGCMPALSPGAAQLATLADKGKVVLQKVQSCTESERYAAFEQGLSALGQLPKIVEADASQFSQKTGSPPTEARSSLLLETLNVLRLFVRAESLSTPPKGEAQAQQTPDFEPEHAWALLAASTWVTDHVQALCRAFLLQKNSLAPTAAESALELGASAVLVDVLKSEVGCEAWVRLVTHAAKFQAWLSSDSTQDALTSVVPKDIGSALLDKSAAAKADELFVARETAALANMRSGVDLDAVAESLRKLQAQTASSDAHMDILNSFEANEVDPTVAALSNLLGSSEAPLVADPMALLVSGDELNWEIEVPAVEKAEHDVLTHQKLSDASATVSQCMACSGKTMASLYAQCLCGGQWWQI